MWPCRSCCCCWVEASVTMLFSPGKSNVSSIVCDEVLELWRKATAQPFSGRSMTKFPEYTYSPTFLSTHVALAWEASRTGFDTWMHKHGCSSQRRPRICLIALNAWSLSSLLHGEVCIDGPLSRKRRYGIVNYPCLRSLEESLFTLKTPQWHSTIRPLLTEKPSKPSCFCPSHPVITSEPFLQAEEDLWGGFPAFLAALYSFISTFNCSDWEHILPLTEAAETECLQKYTLVLLPTSAGMETRRQSSFLNVKVGIFS